jgi:hypothetical protein
MPYTLVLHCLSRNDALIPEDLQGQKTLALFLEELPHKQDAALAARLHTQTAKTLHHGPPHHSKIGRRMVIERAEAARCTKGKTHR